MKYTYLLIISAILLVACSTPENVAMTQGSLPKEVVELYYTSLNNKDYKTMYGLISDGFKQIEPTAKTYEDFEAYMGNFFDTANGIKLKSAEVSSENQKEAKIDYVAEIELKNGNVKELESTFTVRLKPNGWKLIHPYGDKIDNN